MKASEARKTANKISRDKTVAEIRNIEKDIKRSSEHGVYLLQYEIYNPFGISIGEIIEYFQTEGYMISMVGNVRHTGWGFHKDSSVTLQISW